MKRHLVSIAVMLILGAWCNVASAALLLAVDINDRTEGGVLEAGQPLNTAPGFSPYVMSGSPSSTGVVGAYTVKFDAFDDGDPNDGGAAGNQAGQFDDRDRVVPTTTPNSDQLYDDFIFVGASAGPVGGIDLRISGGSLLPNTPYLFSLYAYDGISASFGTATPVRSANWFDGNNSDALVFNATFVVNVPPVTDDQYKFTGIARTDAAGQLFLKGRRVTTADLAVYVNGFLVRNVPEPGSLFLIGVGGVALAGWRRRREN